MGYLVCLQSPCIEKDNTIWKSKMDFVRIKNSEKSKELNSNKKISKKIKRVQGRRIGGTYKVARLGSHAWNLRSFCPYKPDFGI